MDMLTCVLWKLKSALVDALTHRDELRDGDQLFPVGDGVKKQVLYAGHEPASVKIKQNTTNRLCCDLKIGWIPMF